MSFSPEAAQEFYDRLHHDWPELCTKLGIEGQEQERFPPGREAQHIWRWLEVRKRLDRLPDALVAIDRQDLADDLEAGRLPERVAAGSPSRTLPGGPRLSGQLLAQRYGTAADLEKQGRYAEALRQLQMVTAGVLCDRVLLLLQLGRQTEAAQLLDEVDRLHREVGLVEYEADRLTADYYRAAVLWEQGLPKQAESAYRAVLGTRAEVLGAQHPETLRTRCSLAGVLADRGRLGEAEAEYRTVLADRLEVLGKSHPDTALTRYALADLLVRQGRRTDAEAEYRLALQVCEQFLGPEHPSTLAIRHRLVFLQQPQRGRDST
ncbi:tetratricopeptide repeat protein [Plantactinospora endophytica]|uniref:Bacterial Death-like domain-containing protein n=1 Tax=Plantactinospora endophytica TaxID=673535 RepID=A0ABQ4E6D4_9ACTN|nr:tetratricopeptide repeat protein [Plantactinospora endophytica]GIG90269.1 hypothetical protein Pen02_52050 [Plantactinospora endophytica]